MYIGIDPGLSGAVAVLDATGALLALHDTPVLTLRTGRGTRQEYDVPGLVGLLAPYAGLQAHVILEESQAMPGQGTRSMFTIGVGFGAWLGVLAALALPHTRIRPHVWKRALGLGKDKEAARLRAMQLFPGADLRRRKDHGRAEALLLAWYGWQHYGTLAQPQLCGARSHALGTARPA
jgi:crossover junction endodeoxyribonuclease RuvC